MKAIVIVCIIGAALLLYLFVFNTFINPHNARKDAAISTAKSYNAYLGGNNYKHVDDYKGYCIISFDVGSVKYYFAADTDSYINAPFQSIDTLKSVIDRNK